MFDRVKRIVNSNHFFGLCVVALCTLLLVLTLEDETDVNGVDVMEIYKTLIDNEFYKTRNFFEMQVNGTNGSSPSPSPSTGIDTITGDQTINGPITISAAQTNIADGTTVTYTGPVYFAPTARQINLGNGSKMIFASGSNVTMGSPLTFSGTNSSVEFAPGSTANLNNGAVCTLDTPATLEGNMIMNGASNLDLKKGTTMSGTTSMNAGSNGSPTLTTSSSALNLNGTSISTSNPNVTSSTFTAISGAVDATNSQIGVPMGLGGFTSAAVASARKLDLTTVSSINLCGSIVGLRNIASGTAAVVDTSCNERSGRNAFSGQYSSATDPTTVTTTTVRSGGYLIFKNVQGSGDSKGLLVDKADLVFVSGSKVEVWITGGGVFSKPLARYTSANGNCDSIKQATVTIDGCPADSACSVSGQTSGITSHGNCDVVLNVTSDPEGSNSSLYWLLLLLLIPCICCIAAALFMSKKRKGKHHDAMAPVAASGNMGHGYPPVGGSGVAAPVSTPNQSPMAESAVSYPEKV